MNWVSGTSWLWKALRGQSVTFAALFALSLLGLSVVRVLRHMLGALGVPWLALIVLPVVIFGYIAKREKDWMPDEAQRRRWSRNLVFGAVGISVVLALLTPKRPEENGTAASESPSSAPAVRHHGPSGK